MIQMAKLTFTELGRVNLTEGRSVVISKVEETGNISIAHSITTPTDDGNSRSFFLNNSTILNQDGLTEFMAILSKATNNEVHTKTTKKRKVTKNG
jgi:hypothetical protein